jgi:hypothetical protein
VLDAWLEAAGLADEPAPLFFEKERRPSVTHPGAGERAGGDAAPSRPAAPPGAPNE